ncbi:hypothetical protein THAOC_33123 [Thalassiosira oceanica]|uniref:Secreted protein n=1 Tax=Thalassiosira oceanica TaxID=159749 RepID=K0R7R6_THAOC|nr:hypothetical protein THAOC_33123 [Thalassiosira oceanica]|eukprot:EJK48109.1 hypothetical protein THAOC_33123 [Thalassiosira oceanica]
MRSVSILWVIVESILCDGVAWRAPDFGLKSHVKARGLQGDDAVSVARFQLTLAVFRRRCRPPVAIETSEHSHSITWARQSPPTVLQAPSAPDIDHILRIWPSIDAFEASI